ncbi:MAG: dehydratase [Actinobacteria bacterium]|nr:dehydratase [Actinomycetota bacterium]NCG37110.1 dehydratase [Actinomycetota bacterium]
MTTILDGAAAVYGAEGAHLGYSEWLALDQARIDLFAEATGDDQWIHVDPERAAAGPFGATIAHGYLTLSLSNYFLPQIVDVQGFDMGINYGLDKVRFPSPVPVGSLVRAGARLLTVSEIPGGVQTVMEVTMEIKGGSKPACVIHAISRFLND